MTAARVETVLQSLRREFADLRWNAERVDLPDLPPDSLDFYLAAGPIEIILEATGGCPTVRAHFRKFVFEEILVDDLEEFLKAVLGHRYEMLAPRPHRLLPWVRRIRVTGSTRAWLEYR